MCLILLIIYNIVGGFAQQVEHLDFEATQRSSKKKSDYNKKVTSHKNKTKHYISSNDNLVSRHEPQPQNSSHYLFYNHNNPKSEDEQSSVSVGKALLTHIGKIAIK